MKQQPTINLYNQDCMEAMAKMPDNSYELAIVDPPYGSNDAIAIPNNKKLNKQAAKRSSYRQFDNISPDINYWSELFRVSKNQIVWGCNFYRDAGFVGGRIVWDKRGTAFGEAEIAFNSKTQSVSVFRYTWNGMIQGDMKNKEKRIHPTQKPAKLYEWLLKNYASEGDKILDTHGGSMSIAIACHDMGFDLDLYEIDKDYFEAGKQRLETHRSQLQLF